MKENVVSKEEREWRWCSAWPVKHMVSVGPGIVHLSFGLVCFPEVERRARMGPEPE